MDSCDDEVESPVTTTDIGEKIRTWRMFLNVVRWAVGVAAVLLIFLLAFCSRGGL